MEFDIGGKVGMGWVAVVALLFGYLISGINNLKEAPTGRHNATDNCLLQNSLRPLRIFFFTLPIFLTSLIFLLIFLPSVRRRLSILKNLFS